MNTKKVSAMEQHVIVVGAGLAGTECALQLAKRGIHVDLYEMRPKYSSPAHHTDLCAELVCSNSLKSMRVDSAAGLLKQELEAMDSFVLAAAKAHAVDAGGALAVDRVLFSQALTQKILDTPLITLRRERIDNIPSGFVIIAAGPLCAHALFEDIGARLGVDARSFYDAAAPIVDAATIDMNYAFAQSRYQKEGMGADYLNCPFEKEEYEAFWHELINAQRTITKDFEQKDLFSACQPIEEVGRTGIDALRYGALKPVGISYPEGRSTFSRPYANVQLRAENADKTAYNLVGFQTNLSWGEQKRVFRMIPGLKDAEFFRYGVMHRNSFIDSPKCLDARFTIPDSNIRFAGQITGTEGYVEAIASGLFAALNTYCDLKDKQCLSLPNTSAFGSLVAYATNPLTKDFQPMHVNFGIMPALVCPPRSKKDRYRAYADRATCDFNEWMSANRDLFEREDI